MKSELLRTRMDTAWDIVMTRFYNPDTKLLYDYVSGKNGSNGFAHLPTIEDIKASKPNVAGWTSGMEDSVLNGGSMLEAIIARYEITGEPEMKDLAADIFDGLYTCATISDQKGYLARSVSPIDKKTHYINSSRDQYTHWLYMGVLFYRSSLSNEEQKQKIREVLVSFAEKAERDVVAENDFSLLREDGKPGIFCEMYKNTMGRHEVNRYPMFYMAAYMVTGDGHWLEQYKKYRDWALEIAETTTYDTLDRETYCYLFLQMQYSLRLLYDGEEEEAYKLRYYKLMQFIAQIAYKHIRSALNGMDKIIYDMEILDWHTAPEHSYFRERGEDVYSPKINHANETFRLFRNAAEAILIGCICPDFRFSAEQCADIEALLLNAKYEKAFSYWVIQCCGAYWMYRLTQKD